ncbi:ribonuclease H-like domain, gag-pre-integrase domain protein [Tanacetum coccineum]
MADLAFVNQHNMVAYLEKSDENAEFHQIVDFLSTCSINYALTVSPTIYASYIEQFWNTATSKTVNSVKQIHAIVNDRAVVISESSVRNDLLFDDEDGITCLTNDEIFENLALMGYEQLSTKLTFQKGSFSPQWKFLIHTILHCISSKSTAWNEFSTNLASAVICLAKGQKFNFSKLIFDGMLRNLDPKKFLMYPRFLQLFLNNQLKDLPEPFNDTYETPCHTKKVFTNMARKGVKFSGKVTPLFDSMLVPHQAPEGEGSEQPTEPQPTPSPTHPSTGDQPPVTDSSSSHDTTQDSRDSLEDTNEGTQVQSSYDSPLLGDEKAEGGLNLEELFVLCTNLFNRVLALETSKDAQAAEMLKLKDQIKKLKRKCKPSISHYRAWLKSVKRLSMKKRLGRKESVSKQGRKNAIPEPTLDAFNDLDADGRDYMETEDVVKEGRKSNESEELKKGGSTKELVSTAIPKTISTARLELSTARPDVDAARQEDSDVEPITPPTKTSIFDDEDITMAQTLIKMKKEKAKEKGVSIKDIEDSSRPARSILTLKPLLTIDPKDKWKSALEEPEPAKKMTRGDFDAAQIARDVEIARQLQVDLQAEVERERQREEKASKAVIAEMYDEFQVGIDDDALFAANLQQEEREEYTIEDRAKFLAKTIAAQRKFRAAQRSAEIRSKPPTKSQLRNLMMTYLKNMKRVIDDFKPMDSDDAAAGIHKQKVLEEPNSTKVEIKQEGHEKSIRKRPGRRFKMKATKKSKRQKTDADLEEEEQLKAFLKIVSDEEGIIYYEVLEKRFPIINWESKFYDFDRHGAECIYYRIFRSDGSSRWIKTFSKMNQERWNLKSWDLYENCGVHTLILEDGTEIHMLAERKYPLTKETLERMLSLRLVAGTASEDAYTLLRFIQKQIDEYGGHDGELASLEQTASELASPKQTALGKDISNPLIVDSLLKTIWLSMHHVIAMKHWLFQSKQILDSIEKGPYKRLMIPNPDNPQEEIIEPLSKMNEGNKKQYIANVKVMSYILQTIPNDIYSSVDACTNAKDMWERINRLMFSSDITSHVRHSHLMDEFDKFALKEEESLESMYERLRKLVNIMDRNNVCPIPVSINTKFLNFLQPEWRKYVTMKFSTPTNNRLCTLSNTRNQAVIQDERVDIQTKNASYGRNGNGNAGRQNTNQAFNVGNGNDENNQIVQRVPQTKSTPGKANVQEQMLLAMKDEARSNLKDEENDFMLDNSYGDETLEELTDNPQRALKNKGIVDSGCSRAHDWEQGLPSLNTQDYNVGPVAFGVVRMCDNKNSFNLENIVPSGGLACLIAKAIVDESNKWHMRLGHVNLKNINKLVKGNLVRGEKPNKDTGLKTNEEPVDQEDQAFLEELERLKRQEKEANDAAEAIEMKPVSTASSSGGPSYPNLTNYADQDDSQIPALEDIYDNSNDGIFTNASYNDEGVVANFINLETTMNEELLQFKIQKVWILVDLPYEKKAIGTKWVYKNKKDERGVVVRNKASAFSYGTTDEEVYVSQPQGFVVPKFPKKVYKVVKALYGLHQAPRAWSWCDEFEALMKSRFQISSMGKLTLFLGLQVKQKEDGIFISQDKYVAEILKKFDFASVKTDSTPIEIQKPLTKDEEAADVDVHLYRSMIGSLMYLTASRPNIMFVVYPCSRFQVTPKTSHLNAVKRIFRYLKDKPKLGLWYLRVSSFNLEAYSDSDYASVNLDMKSTIGGCHFLSRRLISWQCKKQIIMATSTKRHNVAYYQLLWASIMDSKSNVRLWVQFYEHKGLH